jgi:tetratricopeptide (TPR) repeat protein
LRLAFRGVFVLAGLFLLLAQAIPLLVQVKLEDSQAALRRGDAKGALAAARTARRIEPWAASPYLQLGLVEERMGALRPARTWLRKALERDPRNWQLWLVSARVEAKAGRISAAKASLERAEQLNPRSPIFAAS